MEDDKKEKSVEPEVKDKAEVKPPKKILPVPGILGHKIGMSQIFSGDGVVPVTVIKAGPCFITQIKTKKNDGYCAVQIAFDSKKSISKPAIGRLKKSGLEDQKFRYYREFKMASTDGVPLGEKFDVDIFKVGDKVFISGDSIGKGFAGTVKKYHFARGPMAHGSKSHRIRGSSGSGTSPGRVRKGTRMASRMGGKRVTVKNVVVVRVDAENDLILVRGSVPGKDNSFLTIRK